VLKLMLFLLPVVLYVFATVGVGVFAGEFTPLRDVASLQAGNAPILYGRAYRDNYFAFKLIATQLRNPEVLVLGSSRVMQFRAGFLDRAPHNFYNAGGAIQAVQEIREFLRRLDQSHLPTTIILGLDQPWFNAKTSGDFSARRALNQLDEENTVQFARAMNVSKYVLGDLLAAKITLTQLANRTDPTSGCRAIGLSAIMNGGGFRNDGSYQYGEADDPVHQRFVEGLDRLANDSDHFASGDRVADGVLVELDAVLRFLKERGVRVFAFAPPFAPIIVDKMKQGGRHQYVQMSTQRLAEMFKSYGFVYVDAFDPRLFGTSDVDMVDSFHGSERIMLAIYKTFAEREPETLARYSDSKLLDHVSR